MENNHQASPPEGKFLLQFFEDQVRRLPDKIAVTDPGHRLTYNELNERAEVIAQKLLKAKINNTFAAILLPQSAEFASSVFGVFKAGLTVAPFSIDHSRNQVRDMLAELNDPLILTTTYHLDKLPAGYKNVVLVSDEDLAVEVEVEESYSNGGKSKPNPNQVAFCIFTSGSTGKPKGVLIPDAAVVKMIFSLWHLNNIRDTDKALGYSSTGFILSFREYLGMFLTGGSVHVAPTSIRQDMDKLHEFIVQQEITILCLPTAAASKMMHKNIPTVRWLVLGGEKLNVAIPESLNFKIIYAYGITETLSISANAGSPSGVPHNGKPVRGVEVFIFNSDLVKVSDGEIGEVCVASPTLALGYLNNPTLTAQRFIPNPYNPSQRLFRTGDLGYLNSDGNLVVTGRVDFQIKIMGNRIELEQVEVALKLHPGIKDAAVVPVRIRDSTTLRAFCVPEAGKQLPDLDQVSVFLEQHLPRHGIPTQLIPIPELPMTSSGKVNRVTLRELEVTRVIDPPVTATQIEVATIWSRVLGIPMKEIGLQDTFFSLGGTSLQLALVVTKLQAAPYFLNLRTIHLIKTPRLDKFAELVEKFKLGNFESPDEGNQNDYDGDASLSKDFPLKINYSKLPSSGRILLTGATGYVGANFLTELLIRLRADPTLLVTCLIRADSNTDATARLERTLSKYGLDSDSATDPRVVCLAGDVSKPFFGLSQHTYTELSEQIAVVYHIAAEVHWLKYYSELRESNIIGTRRVLTFVTQGKPKFLHYISTLGVIGGGFDGTEVPESPEPLFSISEKQSKDNGYSQTKRVAEKLIWAAIARGLPGIVYRLGEIGCHSKNTVVNKSDFLARFFTICQKIGFYPIMDKALPYGTIDFTCGAIISIGQDPEKWNGKCFHVFENQMSYLDGFRSVKGLRGLSMTEWTAKLGEVIPSVSDSVQEEYSILLQLIHNQSNSTFSRKNFLNSNTREAVTGSDVNFNFNQDWKRYLDLVLDLN